MNVYIIKTILINNTKRIEIAKIRDGSVIVPYAKHCDLDTTAIAVASGAKQLAEHLIIVYGLDKCEVDKTLNNLDEYGVSVFFKSYP